MLSDIGVPEPEPQPPKPNWQQSRRSHRASLAATLLLWSLSTSACCSQPAAQIVGDQRLTVDAAGNVTMTPALYAATLRALRRCKERSTR